MKTILLVDDDPAIQRTYSKFLRDAGYEVIQAEDAETATELLIRRPVDLVLLDINMPEVNGVVMREVVQIYNRELKVIVSSVDPLTEQRRKIPNADEYFDKSHGTEMLLSLIDKVQKKSKSQAFHAA